MGGTNAVAVKKALLAKLSAVSALSEVQIAYHWPGRTAERECIHGGKTTFVQAKAGFSGYGSATSRDETVTTALWVVVVQPGGTVEDCEDRAAELGTIVENTIANDPQLGKFPGLKLAIVATGSFDSGFNDEGAATTLAYEVSLQAHLT